MAKPKAKPAKRAAPADDGFVPNSSQFFVVRYLEQRALPGVGWDMAVTYAPSYDEAMVIAATLKAIDRHVIGVEPF